MPLDMPPNHNAYTQVKQKIEMVTCFTSTQVDDLSKKEEFTTILDITPYLTFSNSTQLFIKRDNITDHSTWLDFIDENFDVISKISYSKSFKVKAKIKTISKFTPKIIID
jgi:hypothetical protein